MPADPVHPYVSRGGLKLAHALDAFGLDPGGLRCVDLGCSTGGFTDVLLRRGAQRVTCVDTGYGVLAWTLRSDPRVRVRERTNLLHATPAEEESGGLVVIDAGWTPQRLCVPAALRWLDPRAPGHIVTLIKPHYELSAARGLVDGNSASAGAMAVMRHGVLDERVALGIVARVAEEMGSAGVRVLALARSPVPGSKGAARGNTEVFALLRRNADDA